MRPSRLSYFLPLLIILPACGSSNPLSNLKGTYELATGCSVKVSSNSASASCDTTSVKASVKISISEDEVKISQFTWTTKESNTTCFDERECTTTYTGSTAKKGSGKKTPDSGGTDASSDAMAPMATDGGLALDQGSSSGSDGGTTKPPSKAGLFTGLAGDWEGEIKAAIACAKETIKSSAPKSCKATTAETITYNFDATVTAHEAKVTWYGEPKAGKGSFTIYETKSGVRAGDKFFKRSGSSSTAADSASGPAADGGSGG